MDSNHRQDADATWLWLAANNPENPGDDTLSLKRAGHGEFCSRRALTRMLTRSCCPSDSHFPCGRLPGRIDGTATERRDYNICNIWYQPTSKKADRDRITLSRKSCGSLPMISAISAATHRRIRVYYRSIAFSLSLIGRTSIWQVTFPAPAASVA